MNPEHIEPERIIFPVEYPIKVVAHSSPDRRAQVDAVFSRHLGPVQPENVTQRASAQSNFTALTYSMVVQSVEQLQALHADLKRLDGVVMVL